MSFNIIEEAATTTTLNANALPFTPNNNRPPDSNVEHNNSNNRQRTQAARAARKKNNTSFISIEHNHISIQCQNCRGLFRLWKKNGIPIKGTRTYSRKEYVLHLMIRKEIDIYLLNETWIEGNSDTDIGYGYYMFSHNTVRKQDRTGVAIILSPRMVIAWKLAGGNAPKYCDDFTGRFISIKLKFQAYDSRGEEVRHKFLEYFIASTYNPYDGKSTEFTSCLNNIISKVPPSQTIFIAGDLNAQLGRSTVSDDSYTGVLGAYGLDKRDTKGLELLQVLQSNTLCAVNTHFESPTYVTYVSPNDGHYTLDYVIMEQCALKNVISCEVVSDGIDSDHWALRTKLEHPSIEYKPTSISKGEINVTALQYDDNINSDYNQYVANRMAEDTSYEEFNNILKEAAQATASEPITFHQSWFEFNKDVLLDAMDKRSQFKFKKYQLKATISIEPTESQAIELEKINWEIKRLNKFISDQSEVAMRKFYEHHVNIISTKTFSSGLAWKAVEILSLREEAHLKQIKSMSLKKSDGTHTQNDKEVVAEVKPHFNNIYNNQQRSVDWDLLDDLERKQTLYEYDGDFSEVHFEQALKGVANGKAGGENGVLPDLIKSLKGDNRKKVFSYIKQFWDGEYEFESWKSGLLSIIHKPGKPKDDLNNYRGITLMDVISKVFSRMVNDRLFKILDKYCTKFQFGGTPGVGCADAIFTLKSLIHTRGNHGLSTHVAFIDLVKAYDTANHELLIRILEIYGVPPKLRDVIRRMYTDLKVVIKIGKNKIEISQSVGVRQGDNMAPVLFLFLMAAVSDLIDQAWDREGIEKIEFRRPSDEDIHTGQLIRHPVRKDRITGEVMVNDQHISFKVNATIYVDDAAVPFPSRIQVERGLPIVEAIFSRLGMEVHVGEEEEVIDEITGERKVVLTKKSKTEVVWFPAPGELRALAPSILAPQDLQTLDIPQDENETDEVRESRASLQLRLYNESQETDNISMGGVGTTVTYTSEFPYLGSRITFDLDDTRDIDARINAATRNFGAMSNFYRASQVGINEKFRVFMAIQVNLLLWGCESWALKVHLKEKLERCARRMIRRILNISMHDVKDNHITINQLNQKFKNFSGIETLIRVRSMNFLGKLIRGNVKLPSRQMLVAYLDHVRPNWCPLDTNKKSMWKNLKHMMKDARYINIDFVGSFKDFYYCALDSTWWNIMVARILDPSIPVPERPNDGFDYMPRRSRRRQQPPPPPPSPPPSPPRRNVSPPRRNRSARSRNSVLGALEILGFESFTPIDEVKARYRYLAIQYHPDKHSLFGEDNGMSLEETTAHFRVIKDAWEFLREQARREA